MKPIYTDAKAALEGLVADNMTIAAGGFGLCGIPEKLILALRDSDAKARRQAPRWRPTATAKEVRI